MQTIKNGIALDTAVVLPLWKPKFQKHLHYYALYNSIVGFLQQTPHPSRKQEALDYLHRLREAPHNNSRNRLQLDRILWTRAWLMQLEEDANDSDAETILGSYCPESDVALANE